ncbi:hypothetical protein BZA70DRAFT_279019, partial [Myxozyma melibiosi]
MHKPRSPTLPEGLLTPTNPYPTSSPFPSSPVTTLALRASPKPQSKQISSRPDFTLHCRSNPPQMPPARSSNAYASQGMPTAHAMTSQDLAGAFAADQIPQDLVAAAAAAVQPSSRKRKAPTMKTEQHLALQQQSQLQHQQMQHQQQQSQQQMQQGQPQNPMAHAQANQQMIIHQEQPQSLLLIPAPQKRKTRTTWSEAETNDLLRGCNDHGVGNWKKILQDPRFSFNNRSAVDLKDRFRTYFPDEYRRLYPNATTHGGRRQRAPLPNQLPKVNRKERRSFTPEEDRRLLAGFLKHGPSWSKIQKDEELHLFERRSTDLRDRFRNAFPDKYAAAGFKTRPKTSAAARSQSRTAQVEQMPEGTPLDMDLLSNGEWANEVDQSNALFSGADLVDTTGGPDATNVNVFYDASSQLVGRDDSKIPIDPKVTEAASRR